jgi:hypothetical protein
MRPPLCIVALLFVTSCTTGRRAEPARGEPKPDATSGKFAQGVEAPPSWRPMPSDSAAVRSLDSARTRREVLRNAVLGYRRDHGSWPRQIEDVKSLVYEPERFGCVTFTLRDDGGLDVSYTGRVAWTSTIDDMLDDAVGSKFTVYPAGSP